MGQNSKNYIISIIRIIATLSVILLHTASTVSVNNDLFMITNSQKTVLSFIHHSLLFGVPIFFMLTGRLLLDKTKDISYTKVLKKYVPRILLALFIFSFPFACMKLYMETGSLSIMIVPKAFLAVISNQSLSHFWYLYELIGIYLILPIIKAFINTVDKKSIDILLILLFIACFIFPVIEKISDVNIAFKIHISYSIFYLVLGYRLSLNKKSFSCTLLIPVIILLTGLILVSDIYGFSQYLSDYNSPIIALLAVSVYMLLEKIKFDGNNVKACNTIWTLDRLCFGAYLVHPVFIQFTYRFLKVVPTDFNLYGFMIALFFVIFTLASFLVSWIMHKIKPLKKYVL